MKLERLIAASHSEPAARAFRAFKPSKAELELLMEVGTEVLDMVPNVPGACAMMSATYAARLQTFSQAPIYVVAGSLSVRGSRVFGDGQPFDGQRLFSESNPSWDGHAWVMFGPYVADVSLFRTAYSDRSPPLLSSHVRQEFGAGRGLMVVRWSDAPKSGLYYAPEYVLTDDQVTMLFGGAMHMFAPAGEVDQPG